MGGKSCDEKRVLIKVDEKTREEIKKSAKEEGISIIDFLKKIFGGEK